MGKYPLTVWYVKYLSGWISIMHAVASFGLGRMPEADYF